MNNTLPTLRTMASIQISPFHCIFTVPQKTECPQTLRPLPCYLWPMRVHLPSVPVAAASISNEPAPFFPVPAWLVPPQSLEFVSHDIRVQADGSFPAESLALRPPFCWSTFGVIS